MNYGTSERRRGRVRIMAAGVVLMALIILYTLATLSIPLYTVPRQVDGLTGQAEGDPFEGEDEIGNQPGSFPDLVEKLPKAPPSTQPLHCREDPTGDVQGNGEFYDLERADVRMLCASYGERVRLDAGFDPREPGMVPLMDPPPRGVFATFTIDDGSTGRITASVEVEGIQYGGTGLRVSLLPPPPSSCTSAAFWDEPRLMALRL